MSFPRLNEIIRGKRAVTPDTALRLAQVTGMSADFWLGLQSDWDLWHALRSDDAKQIAKLTPAAAGELTRRWPPSLDGKGPAYPFELTDFLLAVEAESPGNPQYDDQTKRVLYLDGRVPEYWGCLNRRTARLFLQALG